MKTLKLTFVYLLFCSYFLTAQNTISPAGGTINSTNGSFSYSLGQLVCNNSSQCHFGEGILNAYSFNLLTRSDKISPDKINIQIGPNPTQETLNIIVDSINQDQLNYQLFDTKGKIISKDKILSPTSKINLKSLNSGCYFLHITNTNGEVEASYKVLKK